MKSKIVGLLIVAAALFVLTGGAWASVLINVQVNNYTPYNPGNPPNGEDPGNPPTLESWTPSYTGGAVIGTTGDIWNQLTDTESVNPTDYLDAAGNSTGVTLTPSYHPIYSCSSAFGTNMMSSYTYNPATMLFNGLTPNTSYDLYIYTQGPAKGRTMTVSVNGVSGTTAQTDLTLSDFVVNKNYLKITANSGVSGILAISAIAGPGSNVPLPDGNEPDINAIQFTETPAAVPEPSTYLLLCLSLGAVGFARKRMSRKEE